jgi:hypothetical protein
MKTARILFLTSMAAASVAFAQNYTGILYEKDSKRGTAIYNLKVTTAVEGTNELVHGQYTSMAGDLVVEEKGVLSGSRLVKYEITQKQKNWSGRIEVKGDEVHFWKSENGKEETAKEKLGRSLVVSSNFQRFVRDNWAALSSGKTVAFRYGVWARAETVGFEIFKISEETVGADKLTVLKMKPSSFVIAALVDPLIFKFKTDGSQLKEMIGRVPPVRKEGAKFKDLDAEVVYSY